MLRLFSTIQKEMLIVLRDRGGLAIMFLMPMAMITIMALIQDAPFRDYQELKIPLLLINNDKGSLGIAVEKGLNESKIFDITKKNSSPEEVKKTVKSGDYEIAVIIPDNATELLNSKVSHFVAAKLSSVGLADSGKTDVKITDGSLNLNVFFSPDTKKSFKASILSSLKQSISKLETQTLLDYFSKELNKDESKVTDKKPIDDFVTLQEVSTIDTPKEALLLNSVQHNVPAWTIFGMFFIVISMSGSIIKERDEGSYTRILTMPGSYITVLAGKTTAYLFICLIQCVLMLLVGIFVLPHLGLPRLIIGNNISAMLLIAIATGLAATGYGVMVGTLFKTHQQSSTFGAVSIVILAALGGIWVPIYVMPEGIRLLAEFSPLNWALSAFHKLFLSEGTIQTILPNLLKLFAFFISTLLVAFIYNKKK